MKLVKMSLAAAVLLGASAFAIDNVKVSGDAKLFYGTNDAGTNDLFDKGTLLNAQDDGVSYGDAALRLGVTGDLLKGVSFGATAYALSTLGLENNLVSNTWTTAHDNAVDDGGWMSELWLAGTMGKTTVKVGRMELDTPLAFSEKWNIVANTFDAAVVINQDLPDTTLVGAWVGKTNGYAAGAGTVNAGAKFTNFAASGAYAAAIVNNSFKPLTAQAWYYNVLDVADAYWLQADIDCQLVPGVKIGAQYAGMDPKAGGNDTEAYAVKLGYSKDALNLAVSYSDVDKTGFLSMANVATGTTSQSKLYTEAWWNYGYVGALGAESINVTAEYDIKNVAKIGAYYTTVDNKIAGSTANVDEITLTVSKDFGPLNATLAYISTDADNQNDADGTADQYNTLQAYLTLNF
jgi:imipenem/basic amino acid-specific outer membrane pore